MLPTIARTLILPPGGISPVGTPPTHAQAISEKKTSRTVRARPTYSEHRCLTFATTAREVNRRACVVGKRRGHIRTVFPGPSREMIYQGISLDRRVVSHRRSIRISCKTSRGEDNARQENQGSRGCCRATKHHVMS